MAYDSCRSRYGSVTLRTVSESWKSFSRTRRTINILQVSKGSVGKLWKYTLLLPFVHKLTFSALVSQGSRPALSMRDSTGKGDGEGKTGHGGKRGTQMKLRFLGSLIWHIQAC